MECRTGVMRYCTAPVLLFLQCSKNTLSTIPSHATFRHDK
jgi:hypothetical protein